MTFEITSPHIMLCGPGRFGELADQVARLGERALVVTGGHLYGSETIQRLFAELRAKGVSVLGADPVVGEPTVDDVDVLAATARSHAADVMVAIGGGSVMDCAKAAAVRVNNPGKTADYQLKRMEITKPPIAQVFAPTTAGTGSEATRVSVLTNREAGVKRSISHPLMTPNVVILDPNLTVSCPPLQSTLCAMDAFSHAIESAVSTSANAYTRSLALAAVEKLAEGLPQVQADPESLEGRMSCLLGSCFAGLSMQAGMGASHSLAPAICIVAGISHSAAVAALLPHVIQLNERRQPGVYDQVAVAMGVTDVARQITMLCQAAGFRNELSQFDLTSADWPAVLEVMNRYASHRQTNPVEVTDDYAKQLFETSLG